ncbi:MAG: YCF48-related protein, partial [bacterium]
AGICGSDDDLKNFRAGHFINSNTGWATGHYLGGGPFTSQEYVCKTTDGGIAWVTQLNNPDWGLSSICFINENTGWAGGSNELWKTTDSGNSWNSQVHYFAKNIKFLNSQTGYLANGSNIYKTTNTGENWFTIGNTNGRDISLIGSNILYTVGGFGSMTKSSNGGNSWIQVSRSISNNLLWSVVFPDINTGFITWSGVIMKTTNSGEIWKSIYYDSSHYFNRITFVNNQTGWTTSGQILNKTTDGGLSWNLQNMNQPGSIEGIEFKNSNTGWLTVEPSGFGYYAVKTTNGGENWISFYAYNYHLDNVEIYSFDDLNIGIVANNVSLVTSNGGLNWQSFPNTYSFNSSSRDDGNNLYACNFNQVYKSTDFGRTWQLISNSIQNSVTIIKMVDSNTGYLAGLRGSLLKSTNGGISWVTQNSMIGTQIRSIAVADTNCWVVGDGGIILSTAKGGTIISGITQNNSLSTDFLLFQNYPNPFNPSTKIQYSLPNNSYVTLKVYNIIGREMQTLVSKEQRSGNYEIEFSGNNLPSGVYFYRLEASNFVQTKRMVLIK